MKRVVSFVLCLVLTVNLLPLTAYASSSQKRDVSAETELATQLRSLGIFKGVTENDFALERAPSRIEAIVLLVRILGKESVAQSGNWTHPFTDVPEWADKFVGYAYSNGLTNGISQTQFGNYAADASTYCSFMLRALGYSDTNSQDFSRSDPFTLARQIGILPDSVDINNFLRADVVRMSYEALTSLMKDSNITLGEKLVSESVFSQQDYQRVVDTKKSTASVSAVSLNIDSAYIAEGEVLKLKAETTPYVDNPKITWSSNSPSYIAVENGTVRVLQSGEATVVITATAESGVSATCKVKMKSNDAPYENGASGLVYKRFPSVLSFENVSSETPVWYHKDMEMQKFGVSKYQYIYLVDTLNDAESLSRKYAYWLKEKGYKLVREEDDPLTGGGMGSDIIYGLLDPTEQYSISVKASYAPAADDWYYDVTITIDYSNETGTQGSSGTETYVPEENKGMAIERLVLSDQTLSITSGETIKIGVTCLPMGAYPQLTFISSNTSVAEVRNIETIHNDHAYDGNSYVDAYSVTAEVFAISPGSTTITITAQNGVKATIAVSVFGDETAKAQAGVDLLKTKLKFPASLSLNSVRVYQGHDTQVVEIDYSAMNGFGGYNRGYFYYSGSTASREDFSIIDKYGYPYITIDLSKLH